VQVKVPFRRLDAHVAEQELDLFKLPAFTNTRDNLRAEGTLRNSLGLVDCAKDGASIDLGGIQPNIYCRFDPAGNGTVRTWPPLPTRSAMTQCSSRCCNVSTARAAASALLRPATQENGNHGVFTLAPETTVIKGRREVACLVQRLANCRSGPNVP
jgi:hypothetical protein